MLQLPRSRARMRELTRCYSFPLLSFPLLCVLNDRFVGVSGALTGVSAALTIVKIYVNY